ncbi:hypothetical protein NM208_g10203 [Fusarium decemcellulare]|uniref:Uncharacterized protein n=1 Tax=Fusarium decemcellulare TaxID=57161 RepID=A0ACC1RYQ3_9HYPO|nr:hypothetical protein NM208_g10203 [Fusarium decemcellulare]
MAKLPKITNTYFVALVATVGGMLFGFDISSIAAIVIRPQYIEYFDNPSGVRQGAIGSALAAGSVFGSLIAGPISDKWGRRDSIMFACLWWLVGTAIQVAVNGFGMLVAGRFLNGVCVGITSSQVPVYLAEIAKRVCLDYVPYCETFMYFIGYGCGFIPGTASFRTAWGTQFIPCVALMIGLPFLPRSPRWLAKVGREEEAVQTLADIQAGGDRTDALVIAEWREISETLLAEREAGGGWRKFFKNGMWKRTMAGLSVQAWQQMSGANVIVYYMTYVFQMANLQGNINLIASGIQYALFIVFTSIMFPFIDKTGRRTLLVWGSIGMAICHFVVAGMLGGYSVPVPEGVDGNANVVMRVTGSPAYTVIAFSYLLIIVYALTLAPVAWIYAAEVWSTGTRATGMAMAAEANWLFNFALGMFTPPGFKNIQYKIFVIFGVLCIGSAIQAFFTYPETCGKTIEEVEELFKKGALPAWKTKKGDSRLVAQVEAVQEAKAHGKLDEVLADTHMPGAIGEKGVNDPAGRVD